MDSVGMMRRALPGWLAADQDRAWPWQGHDVRLRRRRFVSARAIVTVAAVLLVIDGAISLVLPPLPRAGVAEPAVQSPAPVAPAWVDIPAPLHLFALAGSAFARLPLAYEARRTTTGDRRQDLLTYGAFGGPSPFLRFAVSQDGAGPTARPDLLVDLARLAATSGLGVTRVGLPLSLMTRFGLFDTADVTLQRAEAALPCLGFRLAAAGPAAIVGVACGSVAAPIERDALGCVLDRIDLVSAGDDALLRDVFVEAERRRTGECTLARRHGADAP